MPQSFGSSNIGNFKYSVYCSYFRAGSSIEGIAGNTEVYNQPSVKGNRRAIPVNFSNNAEITSISVYHNGGSGNMLVAVYTDNNGNPGSLMGVSLITGIKSTAGWQTVNLNGKVEVSAGNRVWLAWVFENNPGVRYTEGGGTRAESSQTWNSGMPQSFGSSNIGNIRYSVYCSYIEKGSLKSLTIDSEAGEEEINLDKEAFEDFMLYPIPANTYINVSVSSEYDAKNNLHIVDAAGKILLSRQIFTGINRIDIGSLPPGIYHAVIITSKNSKVSKRFIISR